MKKSDIVSAYCEIRTTNNSIPDDVLDFMYQSAIKEYERIYAEEHRKEIYKETCNTMIIQKNCYSISCDDCPFVKKCKSNPVFGENGTIVNHAERYLNSLKVEK